MALSACLAYSQDGVTRSLTAFGHKVSNNMIKKYRKKPVIIEAIRWTGKNLSEIDNFMGGTVENKGTTLVIHTLEGDMTASVGDYIIKGVHGEFYPCKPDIFEQTYEVVE